MPVNITRAQAQLSGTVLQIRLSTPEGVSAIFIEESARLRVFEESPSGGLLLGFVERSSPEVLHVFSARVLAGASPQHLAASLQQFLAARQLSTTGSQSEILGYFSARPSDDGSLAPEDSAFVNQFADHGFRFVITRHADDSANSLWIRGVSDDRAVLVSWDPRPGPSEPSAVSPVPESLAALSDATRFFGTQPVVMTPTTGSAARWLVPGIIGLVTLAAGGGYAYYRSNSQAPVAPEITVSVAGTPVNTPVDPEPVAATSNQNLAWNRDPASTPTSQPQQAATVPPPQAATPEPAQPAKPQPRQLNLDILKRSGPQPNAPQIDAPAPSTSGPVGIGGSQLPVSSNQFKAPPPPPPPVRRETIPTVQNRFVPPHLTRRGGISIPANLLRGLPQNSTVAVEIKLDARGKVLGATVGSASSGVSPFIANLVASAVRSWEFQPATQGGTAVPSTTNVQVNIKRGE